jgi:hypothetical protein
MTKFYILRKNLKCHMFKMKTGNTHPYFKVLIIIIGEIFLKSSRKSQKCHPRFQIWINFMGNPPDVNVNI